MTQQERSCSWKRSTQRATFPTNTSQATLVALSRIIMATATASMHGSRRLVRSAFLPLHLLQPHRFQIRPSVVTFHVAVVLWARLAEYGREAFHRERKRWFKLATRSSEYPDGMELGGPLALGRAEHEIRHHCAPLPCLQ